MSETGILLETGTNELEILEFYIEEMLPGKDKPEPCYFGVNVAKVMQVIESPNLVSPESAPHPSFLGTIPLRDLILPVLDLSVWLGMKKPENEYDVVVVTEFSNAVTGFLVSGVTEIHRVGWNEVIPPSGYMAKMATGSIVGMVDKGDHFIQLLDLEYILAELDTNTAPTVDTSIRAKEEYVALVADDSATIRMMLQQNLEAANFKTIMTSNGKEALDKLLELKQMALDADTDINEFLNIIVSDIEMPLMDGFSLTKNAKEDPVTGSLPVILYSSIITDELRHKGESVKADEQISKPDLDRMAQKAIKLIEERK